MTIRHTFPFLLALTVLASCQGQVIEPDDDGTGAVSSSSSAISSAAAELPAGDFTFTGTANPSGTAYVRGYANTEQVTEPFCETDCEQFTYVFFEVTETSSEDLREYMRQSRDNAYLGASRIGLGCQEASTIIYQNDSDQFGRQQYTIAGTGAVQILNASMLDPVTLRLRKLPFTGGSEAPACYAHFTEVEVVEE